MIVSLINSLVEKNSNLTPKKIAPEHTWESYQGANIFGENSRNSSDWVDVDSPSAYDYLCYGVVDYESIHDRNYDRYN